MGIEGQKVAQIWGQLGAIPPCAKLSRNSRSKVTINFSSRLFA